MGSINRVLSFERGFEFVPCGICNITNPQSMDDVALTNIDPQVSGLEGHPGSRIRSPSGRVFSKATAKGVVPTTGWVPGVPGSVSVVSLTGGPQAVTLTGEHRSVLYDMAGNNDDVTLPLSASLLGQSMFVAPRLLGGSGNLNVKLQGADLFVDGNGITSAADVLLMPGQGLFLLSYGSGRWTYLIQNGLSGAANAIAEWDINTFRYFAIDYDGGSDTNLGYSDVSLAIAGTVALKTLERLEEILPKYGNGRKAAIVIKARAGGAAYRNPGNTQDGALGALYGTQGYVRLLIRATGDLPGEGIVAFSGTNADKRALGARVMTGTSIAGYNVSSVIDVPIASVVPGTPIAVTTVVPHGLNPGDRVYIGRGKGTFSTGTITAIAGALLVDGETFTLNDGKHAPVIFEFNSIGGVTPGNIAVPFSGGDSASTVAASIQSAINGVTEALEIVATSGGGAITNLVNEVQTSLGNNTITDTVADPGFTHTGMSGGYAAMTVGAAGINGHNRVTITGLSSLTLDDTSAYKAYVSDGRIKTWRVQINGGGAPGLTPDVLLAAPLVGKRIRFREDTVTVALRGMCFAIVANGVDTIVVESNDDVSAFATLPTINDAFYIEEPGVAIGVVYTSDTPQDPYSYLYIAGLRLTSGSTPIGDLFYGAYCTGVSSNVVFAFCESDGWVEGDYLNEFWTYYFYSAESGFAYTGTGLRLNREFDAAPVNVPPYCSLVVNRSRAGFLYSFYAPVGGYRSMFMSFVDDFEIGSGYVGQLDFYECGKNNKTVNRATIGSPSLRALRIVKKGSNAPSGSWPFPAIFAHQTSATLRNADIGSGGVVAGVDTSLGIMSDTTGASWTILESRIRVVNMSIFLREASRTAWMIDHESVRLGGVDGSVLMRWAGSDQPGALISQQDLELADLIDPFWNHFINYPTIASQPQASVKGGPAQEAANNSAGGMLTHRVVRLSGVLSTQYPGVQRLDYAQADSAANARKIVGVSRTAVSASADQSFYYENMGGVWVEFESAPTVGNVAYLSQTAIDGKAKDYVPGVGGPASGIKVLLGLIVRVNGTRGLIRWNPSDDPTAPSGGTSFPTVTTYNVSTLLTNAVPEHYARGNAAAGVIVFALPTAVGNTGLRFNISKQDATVNLVTIDADGAELIENSPTFDLLNEDDAVSIVSNGVGWDTY